jgi:hypothetical protein
VTGSGNGLTSIGVFKNLSQSECSQARLFAEPIKFSSSTKLSRVIRNIRSSTTSEE